MSENSDYLRTETRAFRLRADGMLLMLKGASYAALFCFVLLLIGWAFLALARTLPPLSKEAADPTPLSYVAPPDDAQRTI